MAIIITPSEQFDVNDHKEIDKILKHHSGAVVCPESFTKLLDRLKPFIDNGLCKVRFINKMSSPDKIDLLMDDEEKLGYGGVMAYSLFKNKNMDTGMFKDIIMLIVFKKIEDIKESELLDGLENSTMIQID